MTRKKKKEEDTICIEKILWDSADIRKSYQTIIEVLAHDINKAIKEEGLKFDYICGVPRGGCIPAVHLSHHLGIPYKDYSDEEIYVNNVLFVEDIVHSGESVKDLILEHPVLVNKLVCLVKNELSSDNKMIWKYGIEVGKNVWTVFPWEIEPTIAQAIKVLKAHIKMKEDIPDEC